MPLGTPVEEAVVGESTEARVERWVERYGFWTVVACRVSPVLSTDPVSYVAGLMCMGFLRFVIATTLGVIPFAVAVSWFGEDVARMKSGLTWVSVATGLLLVGWIVYDQWVSDDAGDEGA